MSEMTHTEKVRSEEETEYAFERIVGLRTEKDGKYRYRFRLYGYTREDDTWEPREYFPANALRRYHRRIGLPLTG